MAIKQNNPMVDWVIKGSTSQSLARGKNYRDNVCSLEKIANGHWSAEVEGSDTYEVYIWHHGNKEFAAECDCPYDMGGLCKHIVAVVYEIAETNDFETFGDFEEENDVSEEENLEKSTYSGFYDTFFSNSSEKIKEDFLRQLFEKDKSLCQQFLRFATNELLGSTVNIETETPEVVELIQAASIDIKAIAAEIAEDMAVLELDFDSYYEEEGYNDYDYGYGYDDDGEAAAEWATNKIEVEIAPYQKKLTKSLTKNDLSSALDYYIALYEASLICDEEEIYSDVLDEFIGVTVRESIAINQTKIIDFVKKAILSQQDLSMYSQYLLHYWKDEEATGANLSAFAPILIALNQNGKIATETLDFIKSKKLIFSGTADLCFYLAEFVGDAEFWVFVADTLVSSDFNVAKRYLARLKEGKKIKKFHSIAYDIWEKHEQNRSELAILIKDDLIFSEKKALYLICWEYLAASKSDLNIYQSLIVYWNTLQQEKFIDAQKTPRPAFYATILKHEKRNETLLDFIKGNNNSYSLLQYIGDIYPEEAFFLFKQYFIKDENEMKMDRSGYKSYCSRLEYLKDIRVSKEEKQVLVQRLRSIYPNRPAFLDELKKSASKIGLK